MRITFAERQIYQAPLSVLEHLYYYTIQYGLSVRQFTGAHWRYWEKLPKRLSKVQNDPEGLEEIIAELERFAAGSEERLQRRRAQIRKGKWAEKEIVLNAQLLSVLSALPGELLAIGFKKVMGCKNFPPRLQNVDLLIQGGKGEDTDFVEPDLLLMGDRHLLMIEVKTRGGAKSSRDYPPNQFLNYLQLVAKCRDSASSSLPNVFTHLILVPSTDPKWLENHSEWVIETCDSSGRLRIDPDACIRLSKKKASYDYERLKKLVIQIPIYYRSWQQLYEAFEFGIDQFDDMRNHWHWEKIGSEIKKLATRAGMYK